MGHPQAVSKNSADLVNILASGGQPIYLKTPRPVTVFQPPGNADQSPEDWSWFSTEEDGVFTWNKSCLMIPADCKDQFFLQAPYRLPGLTWTFNPESAAISLVNSLYKELTGQNNDLMIRNLQAKTENIFKASLEIFFNWAQVMHASGHTSPAIPLEVRVNTFFAAALCLLQDAGEGGVEFHHRPTLSPNYLASKNALFLDTLMSQHTSGVDSEVMKHERKIMKRVPSFWTNMALHNRCSNCAQIFCTWKDMKEHVCIVTQNALCCATCDYVAKTKIQMTTHLTSICPKPIAAKCYNCDANIRERACICINSNQKFWAKIREFIEGNPLFRVEHIQILKTIQYLHAAGKISFTEDLPPNPWNIQYAAKHIKEADDSQVVEIIQALPCLREEGTKIFFPKNPNSELEMVTLYNMFHDFKASLSNKPTQDGEVTLGGDDTQELTWDMEYLELQEPPLSSEEVADLKIRWRQASRNEKIKIMVDSLTQRNNNLLSHLLQAKVLQEGWPNLKATSCVYTARCLLEELFAKAGAETTQNKEAAENEDDLYAPGLTKTKDSVLLEDLELTNYHQSSVLDSSQSQEGLKNQNDEEDEVSQVGEDSQVTTSTRSKSSKSILKKKGVEFKDTVEVDADWDSFSALGLTAPKTTTQSGGGSPTKNSRTSSPGRSKLSDSIQNENLNSLFGLHQSKGQGSPSRRSASSGGGSPGRQANRSGGRRRTASSSPNPGEDEYECNNESHVAVIPKFGSSIEKIRHVKKNHPCPFAPQCNYFHEFDSVMMIHLSRVHPEPMEKKKEFSCFMCKSEFREESQLEAHIARDHPSCSVCKEPFPNMIELKAHQPCLMVNPDIVPEKTGGANGLLVPMHKAELEEYRVGLPEPSILLAQSLAQLCNTAQMSSESKEAILTPIFQATALIETQRQNKLYPFQAKSVKWPLLHPPNFQHPQGSRESGKFSDFLGTMDAKERWHPSHNPSKALTNFYSLKRINDKISSCVAACHLSMETATVLLKQRIHPDIILAIEAKSNTSSLEWSYEQTLMLCQAQFFQLSLEKLQQEAESLTKDPEEKVHDYFTRCFHLLSTAALGHDEQARSKYVQFHLRKLLLRAVTPTLRQTIENAELEMGIEYTPANILDFYMSHWQTLEEKSNASKSQLATLPVHRVERQRENGGQRGRTKQNRQKLTSSPKKVQLVSSEKEVAESQNVRADSKGAASKGGSCADKGATPSPTSVGAPLSPVFQTNWNAPPPLMAGPPLPPSPFQYPADAKQVRQVSYNNREGNPSYGSQPVPRYPQQGMCLNDGDGYRQAQATARKAQYAIDMKAKLGLPANDMSRFCFRCAAGHPKSSLPYHQASACKVPFSNKVHNCPAGIKLFHEEKDCPFQKKKNINIVRRRTRP